MQSGFLPPVFVDDVLCGGMASSASGGNGNNDGGVVGEGLGTAMGIGSAWNGGGGVVERVMHNTGGGVPLTLLRDIVGDTLSAMNKQQVLSLSLSPATELATNQTRYRAVRQKTAALKIFKIDNHLISSTSCSAKHAFIRTSTNIIKSRC